MSIKVVFIKYLFRYVSRCIAVFYVVDIFGKFFVIASNHNIFHVKKVMFAMEPNAERRSSVTKSGGTQILSQKVKSKKKKKKRSQRRKRNIRQYVHMYGSIKV